jgi:hypothetical protein
MQSQSAKLISASLALNTEVVPYAGGKKITGQNSGPIDL